MNATKNQSLFLQHALLVFYNALHYCIKVRVASRLLSRRSTILRLKLACLIIVHSIVSSISLSRKSKTLIYTSSFKYLSSWISTLSSSFGGSCLAVCCFEPLFDLFRNWDSSYPSLRIWAKLHYTTLNRLHVQVGLRRWVGLLVAGGCVASFLPILNLNRFPRGTNPSPSLRIWAIVHYTAEHWIFFELDFDVGLVLFLVGGVLDVSSDLGLESVSAKDSSLPSLRVLTTLHCPNLDLYRSGFRCWVGSSVVVGGVLLRSFRLNPFPQLGLLHAFSVDLHYTSPKVAWLRRFHYSWIWGIWGLIGLWNCHNAIVDGSERTEFHHVYLLWDTTGHDIGFRLALKWFGFILRSFASD